MNIKSAYYSLVKQYHPDINPTKEAKEIMSIINRAYQEFKINYPSHISITNSLHND